MNIRRMTHDSLGCVFAAVTAGVANRRPRLRSSLAAAILALSALLAVGPSARGDFITQTFTVPQQDTNVATTLEVQQFDPGLGTLYSITFTVTGNFVSQLFASIQDPDATGTQVTTNSVSVSIDLERPDNTSLVTDTQSITQSGTLGSGDYSGPYPSQYSDHSAEGTDALHFDVFLNVSAGGSFTTTDVSDFALFTGLGTLELPFFGNASDENDPGGGLPTIQFNFTQAGATVDVTYQFSPLVQATPEPTSLTLFAIGGAVLLGGLAKRRRQGRVGVDPPSAQPEPA
jgi:hypothetical protein